MKIHHSGQTLREALRFLHKTPSETALALGISNQTLNNWFTRGVPGSRILEVSKFLEVQPEWLASGTGMPLSENEVKELERVNKMNPRQLRAWLRKNRLGRTRSRAEGFAYPEVSWAEAALPSEARLALDFEDFPTHNTDVQAGDTAFWLKVIGTSMTSGSAITFPENYLILVAPDVEPNPGQFVVARMKDRNEATFRQLIREAGDLYLRPLNPAFPIKLHDENWEIVGTVLDGKMPTSLFL